jgi:hypothetical protein
VGNGYWVNVITSGGGVVTVAVPTTTDLFTVKREGLLAICDETHLLHVSGFVLLDRGASKFGFPDLCTTSGCWTHGYWDSHFYWDLDNLGVVEHVAYSRDKYDNGQ